MLQERELEKVNTFYLQKEAEVIIIVTTIKVIPADAWNSSSYASPT
jgi:hypothetical protein